MRLLFCGDVVGRAGRRAVAEHVPALRRDLELDFVVVNGENAAGGFGITAATAGELFDAGVDAVTTGNHVWDQREVVTLLPREPRLLRPVNFPPDTTPGAGFGVYETARGGKALVVNVMGRQFMDPLGDPFAAVAAVLEEHELGLGVAAAIIDVHAETTSEKQALAHFVDSRVSLVVGSHTHVPTADTRHPARRHGVPDRRRDVRRLRFGHRRRQGDVGPEIPDQNAGGAHPAGDGGRRPVRRMRGNRPATGLAREVRRVVRGAGLRES